MNSVSPPATLLLVDDNPVVREALRWALEDASDLVVIGEAEDGDEALARAVELNPDVVLLDIELPGQDGYAVARTLKAAAHPPVIIFLSVHVTPWFRQQATAAGGDAFAEKGLGWPVLIAQIRKTLHQQRQH